MRTRIPRQPCSIALFALFVVKGTAATFTVVSANDNGAGTLRQAILDANATPGVDTISFNIPPGGSASITLTSATFVVTDPVVIDGTTQPGFAGTPVVELTSSFEAPWLPCLQIEAGNSVVRGLSFHGLKGDAVILRDGGTNVIEGNMFGLHRDGVSAHGNAYRAIILINSSFNTIGGTNAAQRNVVAASANAGINLFPGCSHNRIIGNYVGTDVTGTKARGNYRGVTVSVGTNNVIGGAGPGERNIISGSGSTGVQLWIGESNRVVGNYIGTDVSGRFALTNYDVGIYVAAHNFAVIGGDRPGEGNLVSGNRNGGIAIENANNTFSNRVAGNFIGVDVTGTNALPNLNYGLYLSGVSGLQVGGATVGARNVISGNRNAGITISGGFRALPSSIQGNIIGLGADGVTPIPNTSFGIQLIGVPGAIIGGLNPNEGNIISANTDSGIALAQNGFSTLVAGNIIGLDATGTFRRGNGGRGISHGSGTNNAIRANRMAYNAGLGIDLSPAGINTNNVDENNSRPDPLLNFPTIDSATNTGTNILITGTLDGAPGLLYDLEFFLSDFCDPTGFGEGQTFLGTEAVQTDMDGHASFGVAMPTAPGAIITATATAPYGNTSEFSRCVLMAGATNIFQLRIRRTETAAIEWSSAALGYQLQSTTNLTPPVQWTPRTNGIFDDGMIRRYHISQEKPPNIFFRLFRP